MLQDQFQDVTESSFPKLLKRNDNPVWDEWEDTDGDGLVDRQPSYGVAWGDANGDGYADLYLNNHFGDRNGPPPSLYINQQDGTFVNRLDLFPADDRGDIVRGDRHGNIWADFDNDGDQDLIQLVGLNSDSEPSRNKLFINEINEGGIFVDKGVDFGITYPESRAREATVFDFNNDGLLDFIHGSLTDGTKNPELPATVFQQNPDGTFSDVGAAVDFEFDRSYGVEYVALADFTGDGRLDVFQKQPNDVYDITSGKFVKITDSLFDGVTLQNGRGLVDMAIADFNGDLKPDIFLPSSGGNGHQLVLSSPTGWEDKSVESGVRSVSYRTTDGGGVVTGDFDNDGDVDLFALDRNGGPDFIFENQGDGTFTANAFSDTTPLPGVPRPDLRTVAVADYNNDGFLDLLETTHRNDPTYRLLQNKGNSNNWLSIDLEGTESNRDGIGATVYVTAGGVTQMRQQTNGQHHRAQDHKRIHFGLGDQSTISEIRIKWPSGIEQVLTGVTVNQILQVVEAESQFEAIDDSAITSLDTAIDIQVLANDAITPETVFTLSADGASNGSVAVNDNSTPADSSDDFITYTPNANFAGTDAFTYEINNSEGGTDTATVNVTVLNGNLPVATDDSGTVAEDSQITLDVLSNDTDADNDILSLESVLSSSNGNTSIDGNQVVYTPNANFNGTDNFSYTVTDGNGGSATATVTIEVTSVNDAPVANSDTVTTEQNTAVQVQVLANDTDVDGDTLTVVSASGASEGTVEIQNNQILYTPNTDFLGTDSFTYDVSDGNGGTNTATVNVNITEPSIRVEEGLLSLYTFNEGSGNTVFDVSGVGDPLNLEIDTTTGVTGGEGSQITCSCGSCQTCNSQVSWGDGTLNVSSHSLIGSNKVGTKLIDGIQETQEITIEAWIKTNSLTQSGPARIVTLSADAGNRNFTLGQDGDDYEVRLRTTTTGNNGFGKTVTSTGSQVQTEFSHVVYSRDNTGFASLYVNNQLVGSNTIDGDFSNWNAGYQFALANELDSTRHWLGSYDLVAIYNQAFDASEVEQNYLAGASFGDIPTNALPVAVNDSGTVEEDSQLTLNVLANDSDADNDNLTLVSVLPGNNGTTSIEGGQIVYTPTANFSGTDSFDYTVSDGQGGTDTATVTITVNSVNDDPVAVDDTATTDQDSSLLVPVLSNDSDVEGDTLTVLSATAGSAGSTAIENNQIRYTPDAGFVGDDSFSYTVEDGNGGSATATVNITVTESTSSPGNTAPVAVNDSSTLQEDSQLTLNVLANDSDADDDSLSLVSVLPGNNGTTSIEGDQVVYTPTANFSGTDSFDYTVSDGQGGTDTATVTITVNNVNDDPVAVDDTATTDQDSSLLVPVVANDTDVEGDTLTIVSATAGSAGSTAIENNQIRYTPDAGFVGDDSFSYTVEDGNGGTATATVNVTVTDTTTTTGRVNEGLLSLYTFDEGQGSTVFDLSGVGDPLNLEIENLNGISWGNGILDVTAPNLIASNQAATKLIDGITATQELTIEAWITPDNLSQRGPARIATLSSNIGSRNVTLGQDRDEYQTRLRTTTTGNNGVNKLVTSSGDAADTALSHVVYSRDASGLANLYVDNQLVGTNTIDGNFSNWDSQYEFALANELDSSRPWLGSYDLLAIYNQALDASEVTQNYLAGTQITENEPPTNTAPVAVNDSGTLQEDSQLTLNVLANDSDVDDDSLTLVSVLPGNNGITSIESGQIIYTPTANFSGTDSFDYTVSDGQGGTDTATVTITVNDVNDNPIAGDDTTTTDQDSSLLVPVLANDTDIDGDTLTVVSATASSAGNTAIENNQIRYTPDAGFVGDDSFSYTVEDGNGGSATATVNITVTESTSSPGNTAPVAVNDSSTLQEDSQLTLNVLANDSDADDDSLSLVSVLPGNNGTTSIEGDQVVYTPTANFSGTDSFDYTVSDGQGGTDTATVTITVNNVNDDPVAVDDTATTDQDSSLLVPVVANDTDVEGDTLTIVSATAGSAGSTAIENNQIRYTPDAGFVGDDSFSYTVEDGNGGTATATVNVTVTDTTSTGRVNEGLLSLYTFDEGQGNTIFDVSGVGNPLNLEIDDLTGINWGEGNLDITAPNLIASNQAATKLIDGITATQELTIEAWITPDNLSQRGPARIATLSSNIGSRNVTLGQNRDEYQARLRTTTTGNNGVNKLVNSSGDAVDTALSHVVYSRDASGLANLYVDNQLVGTNTIDGNFSNWDSQYEFALANELDGSRPWLGSYDLLAIYNQAFDANEVAQNYLAGADAAFVV